jgi:hypothetical protein
VTLALFGVSLVSPRFRAPGVFSRHGVEEARMPLALGVEEAYSLQ